MPDPDGIEPGVVGLVIEVPPPLPPDDDPEDEPAEDVPVVSADPEAHG